MKRKAQNIQQKTILKNWQLTQQQNKQVKFAKALILKKKLENILSKIQGVGKVKVFINYSQSSETVAMYNENSKVSQTEETDTSGGKRVIESTDSQKDIVFKEENGEKIPITQKIIQPKIEGAIITAQGANDATTKSNIMQAVEAATGIATHKIQVFEMN